MTLNDLGNNGLDVNSIIKIKDLTKNKDNNKTNYAGPSAAF